MRGVGDGREEMSLNLPDGCHLSDIPGWDDDRVIIRKCSNCGETIDYSDNELDIDDCPNCGESLNDCDYEDYEGESREDYDYDRRFE